MMKNINKIQKRKYIDRKYGENLHGKGKKMENNPFRLIYMIFCANFDIFSL